MNNDNLVKIGFHVEDSLLGSHTETMFAEKLSENEYEIRNIPFGVFGVSWGDIVSATPAPDGLLMYDKTIKFSGHSTFRFKVFEDEKGDYTNSVIKRINALGCGTETSGVVENFVTIDVPSEVDPNMIGNLLAEEVKKNKDKFDFEEASVPSSYKSNK